MILHLLSEDLCGIFVKSVIENSMADRSGCIMVNDQIIEVDGASLAGVSNQQAVEILKQTENVVRLKIVRYLRGLKFEELRAGISAANVATPTAPFPPTPATSTVALALGVGRSSNTDEDEDEAAMGRSLQDEEAEVSEGCPEHILQNLMYVLLRLIRKRSSERCRHVRCRRCRLPVASASSFSPLPSFCVSRERRKFPSVSKSLLRQTVGITPKCSPFNVTSFLAATYTDRLGEPFHVLYESQPQTLTATRHVVKRPSSRGCYCCGGS